MKISKNQLRQVIQEELAGVLQEQGLVNELFGYDVPGVTQDDAARWASYVGRAGMSPAGALGGAGRALMSPIDQYIPGMTDMGPGEGFRRGFEVTTRPAAAAADAGTRNILRATDDFAHYMATGGPRQNRAPTPGPTPPPGPTPDPTPTPDVQVDVPDDVGALPPTGPGTEPYTRRGAKQAAKRSFYGTDAGTEKRRMTKAGRQAFRDTWKGGTESATSGPITRRRDLSADELFDTGQAGYGLTRGEERRADRFEKKAAAIRGEDPSRRDIYEEIYEAVIRELGK